MRLCLAGLFLSLCSVGCENAPPYAWPEPQALPYAGRPRYAITNNMTDELSFVEVDGSQPALLGNYPIGDVPVQREGPHHIASTPDGRSIIFNLSNYLAGAGGGPHGAHGNGTVPGSVVRHDARTMERTGEVLVDRNPGDVILSRDGKLAYVTHYDLTRPGDSKLAIIDLSDPTRLRQTFPDMLPICPAAHGEGLSLDGSTLFATCYSDELAIVDVRDPTHPVLRRRVPLGPNAHSDGSGYGPYALAVSPTTGRVYVSCLSAGQVRVYDPVSDAIDESATLTLELGEQPLFSVFTRDGRTLYVPTQGATRLYAFDLAGGSRTVVELGAGVGEQACQNAHAAVLSPDESRILVVCEGEHQTRPYIPGTAVTLSTTPLALLGYTSLLLFPDGAAYLPPAP